MMSLRIKLIVAIHAWKVRYSCPCLQQVGRCLLDIWGEPHTGGSRFNRGTMVMLPKVYATNTEGPTLSVYSTVVQWSRS